MVLGGFVSKVEASWFAENEKSGDGEREGKIEELLLKIS